MSYRIEASVTIMAPPEVVWELAQNVDRRLEWDARITSVQLLTPQPIGKGTRTNLRYRLYGIQMEMDLEMIAWQPPYKSAAKAELKGTTDTIAGSWHFTANPDGSTTWTTKLVLMSRGRFSRLREWTTGPVMRRLTILSQQNLKQLIEREQAIPINRLPSAYS